MFIGDKALGIEERMNKEQRELFHHLILMRNLILSQVVIDEIDRHEAKVYYDLAILMIENAFMNHPRTDKPTQEEITEAIERR